MSLVPVVDDSFPTWRTRLALVLLIRCPASRYLLEIPLAIEAYAFRRKTTLTGVMPMGSEAAGSPSGEGRWSGAALAMFVKKSGLCE